MHMVRWSNYLSYCVAKLPQHFYTLKLVNYGNIYNYYSKLKLI